MSKNVVLVAGGAGFLGSHVCERLLLEGSKVVCLDNLQTGRLENIAHIRSRPGFELVEGDVRTLPAGLPPVSQVWNLACPASPPHYQADPVGTMMTNVVGMHQLLELARQNGARVFQASTSEVYGDPHVHPQPESYRGAVNVTGPRACYDEGKRAAETLCYDYVRLYGMDVRVARIFNTYGPRMDPRDGRVVSNFVMWALRDEPLELYGGGVQTRSFCFVDDLIDGFFALMNRAEAPSGPVNIGNPGEFTVRELGEIIIELIGSRSVFVDRPMPIDDPTQRRPDIDLAKSLLGWTPKIPLREGLRRMIEHYAPVRAATHATV
jgi:UDP-glucuronate decarboxylase